jgi:hypothetical protein
MKKRKAIEIEFVGCAVAIFDRANFESGSLRIAIDIKSLQVNYDDESFQHELDNFLSSIGLSSNVRYSYSDKGMQGYTYVDLDVNDEFCKEVLKLADSGGMWAKVSPPPWQALQPRTVCRDELVVYGLEKEHVLKLVQWLPSQD